LSKGFAELNNNIILYPQRLTSPTVKVRRLGYLAAIPSIIQDREMPIRVLKKAVLDWARENHTFFRHYSLGLPVSRLKRRKLTGEIETLGAAGRYINTCQELGLLVKMKGFRISKIGKAITVLPTNGNPFELSIGKLFVILKSLLEKDYDAFSILLKTSVKKDRDEIEFFRNEMQRRLYEKIELASRMNKLYIVDMLKKRVEYIKNWRSPRRYYLENIKAPRLEWMLDLKFIKHWNQRTNVFELQNSVEEFFKKEIISHDWLQNEYPYIFAEFYSDLFPKELRDWNTLPSDERLVIMNFLISKCMKVFKTGLELGKISANEFFEFSLAFLMQHKSIITPLSSFEKDLINFTRSGKLKFSYVQTVSKADKGYITSL